MVVKLRESKIRKESYDSYEIKKLTMDVAVRKGDQIKGVISSQGRAPLYYDISKVLEKHGYEMAGDYIDVEDGDTDVYVDNEYEFFGENESLNEGVFDYDEDSEDDRALYDMMEQFVAEEFCPKFGLDINEIVQYSRYLEVVESLIHIVKQSRSK